jgi:hypothetical protein
MKRALLIAFSFFTAALVSAQNARIVLNNDPYIVLSGGTVGTPIYFVVGNPNTNAITLFTAQITGGFKSEAEFNMVKWNISTNTGTYVVPFTKAFGGPILPVTVAITGAGTGTGNIKFSTYTGGSFDNNTYKPSDVTHTNDLATGLSNNSVFVTDRFWIIDANGYTSNATRPSLSPITFTYADAENNAPNTITEASLLAQRFNSSLNKWGDFLGSASTANTVSNTVTTGAVTGTDFFRSWTLSDAISPMPIELSSFNGQCFSGNVLITWSTASETNNDHFTIERTLDGDTYETVAVVNGAGTSSQPHYYSVADARPFTGVAYYRIRQTDKDGTVELFGLISVESCSGNSGDAIVNAFNAYGNTAVWFNADQDKQADVKIMDITGRVVSSIQTSFIKGFNEVMVPSVLPSGIYTIICTTASGMLSRKLAIFH